MMVDSCFEDGHFSDVIMTRSIIMTCIDLMGNTAFSLNIIMCNDYIMLKRQNK